MRPLEEAEISDEGWWQRARSRALCGGRWDAARRVLLLAISAAGSVATLLYLLHADFASAVRAFAGTMVVLIGLLIV